MSCWFPGFVRGVPVPDLNALAQVLTGAPETPEMGLVTDLSTALEDNNIHPTPSDSSSATGQVCISTGVAIPSASPGSSASEQPLPCVPR